MAYGNNRAAARPKASFQVAGGMTMKFRHPFLAGQIQADSAVDEIDVSAAMKLNDEFLNATPAQDSAFQETLVDGSVITITNHLLNGSLNLRVLPTTGFVGTGDFIEALQLIQGSKDDVGGTLTCIDYFNGKRRVTVFYGVAVKNVPHMIKAGNSVPVYSVTLLYSGWVRGASANGDVNTKTIWAVGNKYGLKAVYKPFTINNAENSNNFYGGDMLGVNAVTGVDTSKYGDSNDSDPDTVEQVADGKTAPASTWVAQGDIEEETLDAGGSVVAPVNSPSY